MSNLKILVHKNICVAAAKERLSDIYRLRDRLMQEAIERKMNEKSFLTKKLKYPTKEAARESLKSGKDYCGFWDNEEQSILNAHIYTEEDLKTVLNMLAHHAKDFVSIDKDTFKLLGFDRE